MQNIFLSFFIFFTLLCNAQAKTEIILLGTYHMAGTSDEIKVDTSRDDILGNKRQKELESLLDIVSKFNAERIYVENLPSRQFYWDSIYKSYNNGEIVKSRNEIFQIGIRLAKRLNLKQGVTCVDWQFESPKYESEKRFAAYSKDMFGLADSLIITDTEFSVYDKIVMDEMEAFNYEIPEMNLVSVYEQMNSREHLKKLYYANITTYLDENAGGMGVFWTQYQMMRNYNIYSNIIKDILKNHPQKVLVLYGAGHIEALRSMFESHPAIEIVEYNTLYNNGKTAKRI